jgi:hypothetical protein
MNEEKRATPYRRNTKKKNAENTEKRKEVLKRTELMASPNGWEIRE